MAPGLLSVISIHYLIYFVNSKSFLRLSNRGGGGASGKFPPGPIAYLDKRCTGKSLFHFLPRFEGAIPGARSRYALIADKYPETPLSTVYASDSQGKARTGRLIAVRSHNSTGVEPGYFLLHPLLNGGYNIIDSTTGNILACTSQKTVEFIPRSKLVGRRKRVAAEFKLHHTSKANLRNLLCFRKLRKRTPKMTKAFGV